MSIQEVELVRTMSVDRKKQGRIRASHHFKKPFDKIKNKINLNWHEDDRDSSEERIRRSSLPKEEENVQRLHTG